MRKNIPELFHMFSVCANQYDFNLMGAGEVLLFFLIFMFAMAVFGDLFLLKADVKHVLRTEIGPMH